MRKVLGKFMKTLLMLTLCLMLFKPMAFAMDIKSSGIPIKVSLDGSPPEAEEVYEIVIRAGDLTYPMPDDSEEGVFTMNISGEDTKGLPEIKFTSLGVYKYTISQKAGTNELATYDDSIYDLVVYVTNKEAEQGFEITNLLYRDGDTKKYDEIVFNNKYEELVEPEREKPKEQDALPKTGQAPSGMYLLVGAMFVTTGLLLKRKKD
ncbi:MAG: LPXTG cell wall anchor domain-containing protein [Clostridiales bacterium]|nr:LPXTG cell wall anchor domain-containing protein [Clostridiales bacterium]